MNILLHLNNPHGLGADRWVLEGYKDAFEDLGHTVRYFTEQDRLETILSSCAPDIFFTHIDVMRKEPRAVELLEGAHGKGTKIFFNVGEDFRKMLPALNVLIEKRLVMFYSIYAPEIMEGFEEATGAPLLFLPLAANKLLHYPTTPDPRYESDIAFLGARLATKEFIFKNVLIPLSKKYRVAIYGPGWTLKDKVLRMISGAGRRGKLFPLAEWANKRRISVPPGDEKKIYSSAKISINIHEYYKEGVSKNLSNEREFKIPACGGFQLSDYVKGIERFFVPDKEIVIARTTDDWFRAVEFYLPREKERKTIQDAGTRKAQKDHLYHNRVAEVLKACQTLS